MHQYGAGTHVGNVRSNNEDSYVCDADKKLWIVADGMGGLGFGEVASAIATFTVTRMVRENHGINQAIEIAHAQIKAYAESDGMGTNMGTTIVLLLSQGSLYNIFWVGDSRAYSLENDEFKQVTVDHSLVQSLIDQGELTPEEAETDPRKNAVTRALGVQELETVRADSISDKWKPGQKIVLCSDGLTDCVSKNGIETILRGEGTDQELTDRLIEAALEGGGKDNVTVIVISATNTTRYADTDTHVPAGMSSEDTLPPGTYSDNEDTDPNARFIAPDGALDGNGQLELDIRPPTASNNPHQISKPLTWFQALRRFAVTARAKTVASRSVSTSTFFATNPFAALSFMAILAILIVTSLSFTDSGESDSPAFSTIQPILSAGSQQVYLPPPPVKFSEFRRPGRFIQVGIFTRLEGAEANQLLVSELGLNPYVQKRNTANGVLYAVMLGPFSVQAHDATVETLETNNVAFFHRSVFEHASFDQRSFLLSDRGS